MSLVECPASNWLNGSPGFVRDIPGEHSPDDTSILVGKRHGRDVRMTTLAKASKPTASRILLAPAWPLTGFPDRRFRPFRINVVITLQFICAQTQTYSALGSPVMPLPQAQTLDSCRP